MTYIVGRKDKAGEVTSYQVKWRLGGGRATPVQTERFDDEQSADVFKNAVDDHAQQWPPGWVKGKGCVTTLTGTDDDPKYRFRVYATLGVENRTGIEEYYRLAIPERYVFPTFGECGVRPTEHFSQDTIRPWVRQLEKTLVSVGREPKRLEDFDFAANPNVTPEVVGSLNSRTWVRQGRPLVLIGDSGTGKSHLLIGVGTAIAELGMPVRYTTTATLVNELAEAEAGKRLSSVIARYTKVDLLCLDEFSYLTEGRQAVVPDFHRTRRARGHRRWHPTPHSESGTRPSPTPALLSHRRSPHVHVRTRADRHRFLSAPGHRSRTPGRPVNAPPRTARENSEARGGRTDGRR